MRRLIRLPEVLTMTGLCRSEIYRHEAAGQFPCRVPLSARCTAWDASEVEKWIEQRIAARQREIEHRKTIGAKLAAARQRP